MLFEQLKFSFVFKIIFLKIRKIYDKNCNFETSKNGANADNTYSGAYRFTCGRISAVFRSIPICQLRAPRPSHPRNFSGAYTVQLWMDISCIPETYPFTPSAI